MLWERPARGRDHTVLIPKAAEASLGERGPWGSMEDPSVWSLDAQRPVARAALAGHDALENSL